MKCIATFLIIVPIVFGQPARATGPKAILVFGDSLSEGFMLKHSEAYPALLARKLRAAGLNFLVTNASASGGTTDGGLERLPPHLKHKIDILILELGINDAFRGVPINQIQSNLQEIIDKVKARNPNSRVVIAGIQLPNYSTDDYVSAFGTMFADLAAKNQAEWRRANNRERRTSRRLRCHVERSVTSQTLCCETAKPHNLRFFASLRMTF